MRNNALGRWGEDIACGYLCDKGYEILARNFRYKRFGELDIVAIDRGVLVFVEVKTRSGVRFGNPEEAVTRVKMRKIRLVGTYYMALNRLSCSCRVDVISVLCENNVFKIQHITNVGST